MTGDQATATEYRLSWEMPASHEVDAYEQLNGRDVWRRFNWNELHLTWHTTTRITQDPDVADQHATLARWAETREQPIRNVRLEQRQVLASDEGWEPVRG